jgi:hypothetical protein
MPIVLIVGLAVGIPAIIGVLILCSIFGMAFFAVRQVADEQARIHEEVIANREQPVAKPIPNLPPLPKIPGTNMCDLIALLDPKKDSVDPQKWVVANKELRCIEGNFVPRIEIPYIPPTEYDFIVNFSQPGLRNGISLIMPNPNGGSFFWYIAREGGQYGFGANPDKEMQAPGLVKPNTAYTTTVQVRRNSVRTLLDGKELMSFKTDFKELTCDDWRRIRDPRLLAVACDDPTVFHSVRVIEVNGAGKRMR